MVALDFANNIYVAGETSGSRELGTTSFLLWISSRCWTHGLVLTSEIDACPGYLSRLVILDSTNIGKIIRHTISGYLTN
jgi:hypothetical protein